MMQPAIKYTVSWKTKDRNLIRKVCTYLGIPPYMDINRCTPVGTLTQEQVQALQPLVQNGSISLYRFTNKETTKFNLVQ